MSDVYYAGDPDAKILPRGPGRRRLQPRTLAIYEVADPDRAALLPPDIRGGV